MNADEVIDESTDHVCRCGYRYAVTSDGSHVLIRASVDVIGKGVRCCGGSAGEGDQRGC